MKRALLLSAAAAAVLISGCSSQKTYLSLGFDKQDMVYNFVSQRDITLTLEGSKSGKKQNASEKLNMQIAYKPVEVDELGSTVLEAECRDISVQRSSFTGKKRSSDPLEVLEGEKWKIKINSAGEIEDYSGLQEALAKAGKQAIKESGKRRIKDPDMILDFAASQWTLWNAVASANKKSFGISPGQEWESVLMVPFAVGIPAERIVTYSLPPEIQPEDESRMIIKSSYELSTYKEAEDGKLKFTPSIEPRPKPYEGSFQTKGMFGFLRNYKPLSLEGEGKTVYDQLEGVLISETQEYDMVMEAGFMIPLGDSVPKLDVHQKITVELAE
ncbi:hypothetical protein [Sedimentisphaera salicampi]|uniref:Uncharacterized protein n=1 Tax=Sedimentisphaera salicampi TaxID=1941349 RepID=A0A1W6LKP2_9BACT|nr:hypothetical protein [Sedimentisphaera salicampi]ARN56368.1 hypothetical protein STSP1_00749 [Sedimentisphaera salicampi]OXU15254.1 hypothetical protein SMSP1_00733 [Sedimentisphaera salicampi]